MNAVAHDLTKELGCLQADLKSVFAQTDAQVARINALIDRLRDTHVLQPFTLLGEPLHVLDPRPDDPQFKTTYQAALLIPEGLGLLKCATDGYLITMGMPNVDVELQRQFIRQHFTEYAKCGPTQRNLIVPHLDELIDELHDICLLADTSADREGAMAAELFFTQELAARQHQP